MMSVQHTATAADAVNDCRVVLKRLGATQASLASFRVLVDGKLMGRVSNNGTLGFSLPAGTLGIVLKHSLIDKTFTRHPYAVEAVPSATLHLRCRFSKGEHWYSNDHVVIEQRNGQSEWELLPEVEDDEVPEQESYVEQQSYGDVEETLRDLRSLPIVLSTSIRLSHRHVYLLLLMANALSSLGLLGAYLLFSFRMSMLGFGTPFKADRVFASAPRFFVLFCLVALFGFIWRKVPAISVKHGTIRGCVNALCYENARTRHESVAEGVRKCMWFLALPAITVLAVALCVVVPTFSTDLVALNLSWLTYLSANAFLLMGADKYQAIRRELGATERDSWRVPEKALHAFELCGGWPGSRVAQIIFRHKTEDEGYQAAYRRRVFWYWFFQTIPICVLLLMVWTRNW